MALLNLKWLTSDETNAGKMVSISANGNVEFLDSSPVSSDEKSVIGKSDFVLYIPGKIDSEAVTTDILTDKKVDFYFMSTVNYQVEKITWHCNIDDSGATQPVMQLKYVRNSTEYNIGNAYTLSDLSDQSETITGVTLNPGDQLRIGVTTVGTSKDAEGVWVYISGKFVS